MPRKRLWQCLACACGVSPRTMEVHGAQLCESCFSGATAYPGIDTRRQRIYGITPEKYGRIYAMQRGKCALCKNKRPLVIDHDHATGEVRGLLCNRCNLALGLLGDDLDTVRRAALYVEKPLAQSNRATTEIRIKR